MQMELNGILAEEKAITGSMEVPGSSSERLVRIPREEVWEWIPQLPALFKSAVARSRGEYSVEDLAAGLLTGKLQLLLGRKGPYNFAYALVAFEQYAEYLALNVFVTSGMGLSSIVKLMPQIKEYALENGATQVRLFGRDWSKVLAPHGFKKAAVLLTWDAEDGRKWLWQSNG